jgi:hypothetical protein
MQNPVTSKWRQKNKNKKNLAKPRSAKNLRGEGPQKDKHPPQKSSFPGHFFCMTTFCIAFYESNLSTVVPDGHELLAGVPAVHHE